jgi:hypothetical protein
MFFSPRLKDYPLLHGKGPSGDVLNFVNLVILRRQTSDVFAPGCHFHLLVRLLSNHRTHHPHANLSPEQKLRSWRIELTPGVEKTSQTKK